MKKSLLFLVILTITITYSKADEGMWMLAFIDKNIDDMKKAGFKLSAKDVYDINNASLKDAVVQFGGYCTGEIVSSKGLLFTNHHCGFESIQQLSTLDNNFIEKGFFAKNQTEELSVPGLYVDFFIRMEDVTKIILGAADGKLDKEREAAIKTKTSELIGNAQVGGKYIVEIKPVYRAAEYYMFVYQRYTDIRLVAAPPSSIGNFGGDTDNWMWPRHTGDFSVFRVYADKDNAPAAYSKENIAYAPKRHLTINTKGLNEGDFTMTIGYPGSTNRYLTSYAVQNQLGLFYPAIVNAEKISLDEMKKAMDADLQTKIDLASTYAQISNGYKLFTGQSEATAVSRVLSRKMAEENAFKKWAAQKNKKEYTDALDNLAKIYEEYDQFASTMAYTSQLGSGSEALAFAGEFSALEEALSSNEKETISATAEGLNKMTDELFATYRADIDQGIFGRMIKLYMSKVPDDQQMDFFKSNFTSDAAIDAWVNNAFTNSIFTNKDRASSFLANPDLARLSNDPIYQYTGAVKMRSMEYQMKMASYRSIFNKENGVYIKGMKEMHPTKKFYPDANFTMRASYGKVTSLQPRDAVSYDYYTTLDGVVEKNKNGDAEFDVPQKLEDIYAKKDFGSYAKKDGKVVACFISTNDITGGNSGSPVLNGSGELVGIAFDGNWEGAIGDYCYDATVNRTISVDINYVLLVLTKFGGMNYLLKEMTIK